MPNLNPHSESVRLVEVRDPIQPSFVCREVPNHRIRLVTV